MTHFIKIPYMFQFRVSILTPAGGPFTKTDHTFILPRQKFSSPKISRQNFPAKTRASDWSGFSRQKVFTLFFVSPKYSRQKYSPLIGQYFPAKMFSPNSLTSFKPAKPGTILLVCCYKTCSFSIYIHVHLDQYSQNLDLMLDHKPSNHHSIGKKHLSSQT